MALQCLLSFLKKRSLQDEKELFSIARKIMGARLPGSTCRPSTCSIKCAANVHLSSRDNSKVLFFEGNAYPSRSSRPKKIDNIVRFKR